MPQTEFVRGLGSLKMPLGLLSNLNAAFGFGFPRAARVKQYQSLHLIEALFLQKTFNCSTHTMATCCCSKVARGDVVVDKLLSSGSFSGFVKPSSVYLGSRSHDRAKLSLKIGFLSGSERSRIRTFSSSCYSDVSADGSLSAQGFAVSEKQSLKLLSGACYLPHPAKEKTGGEDAHFVCADEQVIGVADGVGGWADVGVNAGLYARELMSHAVEAIKQGPDDVDPYAVLEKAHAATNAMGSSTAVIIALKNQDLQAINLGDSGFMIVRDGAIIFESPVQLHGFNFTYQLERGNQGDLPSSGQIFKIPVVPGDVVVAGSDGLFDNLYAKEIAALVAEAVNEKLSPNDTAQKIAALARVRALDMKHPSPFSAAAQKAGYLYYGGKLDDLTVVVSYVSS